MMDWLVVFFIFSGSVLMLLAGLGILRMPDIFTRMHASTKAASLGVGLLLLAAALYFRELGVVTKAITTIVFVFLTAPVGAHMLGRVAYLRGPDMWKNSIIDEAEGRLKLPETSSKSPFASKGD